MEKKKRLEWLDVAKAIGVYLVILGHLVIFNYHTFRFIFAFHMPLFFVVAGYVSGKGSSFKSFLGKCCRHYLLPYGIVLLLGLVQCLILPIGGRNMASFLQADSLEKAFYYGHPCYSFFGSAWFLLAMFWAQLMFFGMKTAGKKLKKYVVVLLWILLVFLALFAKDIFSFIPHFERLPLKLDSALMATVFLGIGSLLKKTGIWEKCKWYVSLLFVIAGGIVTWLFGCRWNYYVNLCDCDYAKEYNYIIAAVAGCIMVFGLGQLLKKSKVLQFIGKNTLFIFLAHEAIYLLILNLINKFFGKSFASQSMQLDGWSIGVSLLTLSVAALLAWLFQKIKLRLCRKKPITEKKI